MNADIDFIGTVIADYSLGRHRGLTDDETQERAERALSWLVEEVESLQAQLAEIAEKPERTSPVRYYTDGKPYVQIGGFELHDHPVTEACARLDRYERYIIPRLQTQLAESQRRERAAIKDIKSYHSCRQCKHHVPNEKPWCVGSCKSTPTGTNCENWQWRGPVED